MSGHAKRTQRGAPLTPAERVVADRFRRFGECNKVLAFHLGICQHTLKIHLHHIQKKMGLDNRTQLALKLAGVLEEPQDEHARKTTTPDVDADSRDPPGLCRRGAAAGHRP